MQTAREQFRNWPIRRKLIFTGLLTSSIALVMAGTSITGYQWFQYRGDVIAELNSVADMIAVNSSAPLIFGDKQSAVRTLVPLKAEKRVAEAAIYKAGNLFATFIRPGLKGSHFPLVTRVQDQTFEWFSLRISRPIVVDGEYLGDVYIRSDMPDLGSRLYRNCSIMIGVMFVAALVAVFATSVVQRLISRPIQHLADVARQVSSGNNYGIRAVREASDELGVLTDTFNSMLEQIESRDLYLETEVTARTAELTQTNQELIVSRDKAEEAARLKSEFLANMSHEIRTPMNIIIGMTQLTLDTELGPRQRRHLSMVRSSADALLILINDILDFSKIEADKLDLNSVNFGLAECVRERTASLTVRAQEKGLDLNISIDQDVPKTVVGDPARLGQIFVNLIENGIKFSATGKISLHVSLEERPAEDSILLRFSVTDNGIGIPADKLGTIFEAFRQADGSTTRQYGGTGLGLSISRKLVEMMGGRIWVESVPGSGSKFIFTVRAGLPAPVSASSTPLASHDATRGIVIMREQEQRSVLTEMLTNWHIDAASVDSPYTAVEVLKWSCKVGRPFSFALIESTLAAQEDGIFMREIQASPALANLPIVLIDCSGSHSGLAEGLEQAVSLTKMEWPVSQSALLQTITGLNPPLKDTSRSLTALSVALSPQLSKVGAGNAPETWRILVAEDNAANQELILALLHTRVSPESIQIANNGQEALKAATEEQFDLILMDIQMPHLGGIEVTTALRLIEGDRGGSHTPIIALTANAMKGDRETYLQSGMNGYVSKPINVDSLFLEIERVTQGQTRRNRKRGTAALPTIGLSRATLVS